jgi:hypothetical protein
MYNQINDLNDGREEIHLKCIGRDAHHAMRRTPKRDIGLLFGKEDEEHEEIRSDPARRRRAGANRAVGRRG